MDHRDRRGPKENRAHGADHQRAPPGHLRRRFRDGHGNIPNPRITFPARIGFMKRQPARPGFLKPNQGRSRAELLRAASGMAALLGIEPEFQRRVSG
jgi:hypothetical protein